MANHKVRIFEENLTELDLESAKEKSFFGYDNRLSSIVPSGHELPTHLILTLDNNNQQVSALGVDVGPLIRLVHPFHYSQAGRFAYHHRSANVIEFTQFDGSGDASWPHGNLPRVFPRRKIELIANELDSQRDLDDCSTIFIGNSAPLMQNYDDYGCISCSKGKPILIASVPSRPIPELNIWDNDSVFAIFWFCPACKAVITHNECD